MILKTFQAIIILLFATFFLSCKKNDSAAFLKASSYYPIHEGMVWVYHMDSTSISTFGTMLVTNSYHLKDSAGTFFFDNTGRKSWPVYRFITDTLEQTPWRSISTYYVTQAGNNIEMIDDNNLRFIKLITPIGLGIKWQGNSYVDTKSSNAPYQYLDGWEYFYDSINRPYTTLAGVIDSTVVVQQRDETLPDGPFDPQYYQQRNYSIEVYAYNTGLIYKSFLHWTWQPTPAPAHYEDGSYGIILNLLRTKQ